MSNDGMGGENRSVDIGRDVKESVIIPGNSNTANIAITNYYYREDTQVIPVESTDAADEHRVIAEVYAKISEPQKAASLLEQAIKSADSISESHDKALALSAIAEVAAKYKNWGLALEATNKCRSEYCRVQSLTKVLTIHAEQKNPELKEEED